MSPGGFGLNQKGVKKKAAVVIEGSNEVPFFFGGWGPEVIGGVMLDEFSYVVG